IVAARLLDGPKDIVLGGGVAQAVAAPGERELAVFVLTQELRPAQADADAVAPAHARSETQDLLLVPSVAVQKDQERIRVVRFIAGGQKSSHGLAGGGLELRRV